VTYDLDEEGWTPCETDLVIAAHAVVGRPIDDCWETVWQIGDFEADPLNSPTLSDEFGGKNGDGTLYALSDPLDYNIPPNDFTRDYDFDTDAFPHAFAPDGWTAGTFDGFVSTVNINYTEDMPFGGQLAWRWTAGNSGFETYDVSHDGSLLDTYVDRGGYTQEEPPQVGEGFYSYTQDIPASLGAQVITFYHYANDDPVGSNPDGGDGGRWDWITLERPCEQWVTAWAGGECDDKPNVEDFPGNNWATYFTYHVMHCGCDLTGDWALQFVWEEPFSATYDHGMTIDMQNADGTFSGTGGYPLDGPYTKTWTVSGDLLDSSVAMIIAYDSPSTYVADLSGNMAADCNSMSGTFSGSGPNYPTGTWTATRLTSP
jgi:hypothetical protein